MNEKNNKKTVFIITIFVLFLAFAFCVALSASYGKTTTEQGLLPRNFNTDGSITPGNTLSSRNSGNFVSNLNTAEGDPSLLEHSEIINVVIFIYFSDETESVNISPLTTAAVMEKLNGETVSMYDYYRTLSYGVFSVRSVAPLSSSQTSYYVYKDSNRRSYYNNVKSETGSSRYVPESTLLNSAVASADKYFDYTGLDLDANNDGFVDSVSFVISGNSSGNWGSLMWPHAWNLNTITATASAGSSSSTLNGLKVDNYTFTFASSFPVGLVTHEFGHIVGLPDYYHYSHDKERLPVGYWDLMHLDASLPQFMTSYTRDKYLNFLDKKQVVELTVGGTYSLKPTVYCDRTDIVAYKVTLNANESIWFEYRTNNARTYDRGLPSSGLLVYRANTSVNGNNDGKYQNSRYPDELYIYRPTLAATEAIEGLRNKELYELGRAALNLSETGRASLGNPTSTALFNSSCIYLSNGVNTGIVVTVTEQTETGLTFEIDLGKYDASDISESYVLGTNTDGSKKIRNESYVYFGQTPDISVFVKYNSRPTAIEVTDYTLEYDRDVCPEGQTAYVIFTDAFGERRLPFTLYIYDVAKLEATVITPPALKVYSVGSPLDLTGLVISVDYLSGKRERIAYSDSNASDWTITEGFDSNVSGSYNHITVRYGNKIYFTLSGIIVTSELKYVRVDEKNTRHIHGTLFASSFTVIGFYKDGTNRVLSSDEYETTFLTSNPNEKTIVRLTSKENSDIYTDSYVYIVGDETITSVQEIASPQNLTVDYGKEPYFVGGKIALSFTNDFSVDGENALPLENYSSALLKNFSPTKTGNQELVLNLGNASYKLTVTVLPQSGDFVKLTGSSNDIRLDEKKSRILLYDEYTLSELSAKLTSALKIAFYDTEEKYELIEHAYSERKMGASSSLYILAETGKTLAVYSVYRIGDCDGDGVIDDVDREGWITAIMSEKPYNYPFLDVNGDNVFTLTDFVNLFELEGE